MHVHDPGNSASNGATEAASPSRRTALAVERLLRPLVRLLVGRVACIYLVDRLRRLYVAESRAWLERTHPGQRITRSRLAMLTGLDTRTIASIEAAQGGPDTELPATELCAGSMVIERWLTDPAFHDERGAPARLALMGPNRSFQALTTRAIGRNITPHTVLDELVESGNAAVDEDERIRLVDPVYRPVRPSEETALDLGSHSIARLVETVRGNADDSSHGACRLQQDRLSTRIPVGRRDELDARARDLLRRQIEEMECLLREYEVADQDAEGRGAEMARFGVGWYVFD
ncbi:DUF6502 family protein [Halomonas denitrificans]|nr:hypothetical protein [Halomonas denitrificans]